MISRLTVRIDDGPNAAARAWAARLLAHVCGFPFRLEVLPVNAKPLRGPLLYYGKRKGLGGVTIEQSDFFDRPLDRRLTVPDKPSAEVGGLPVVFGGCAVERSKDSTVISADLLASAFFLASRLEERFSGERDRHGRFPASASFVGRNGLLERPIVDEYAGFLAAEVTRIYPALTRRYPWPVVTRFAVCVTHDIETLKAPSRLGYLKAKILSAGRATASGDISKGIEQGAAGLIRALSGHNPTWSFDRLRDAMRPWPATFFFFGGATDPLDGAYDVESARVREMIAALGADGCEIATHLGYSTGCDDGLMKAQVSKVASASGRPVRGVRHHYLKAEFPDVWKAHEKAGFAFDATLGFPEAAGYRAGTSYPFRPFDVDSGRALFVVEIPLIVMDGSFFQYQRLSPDETIQRVLSLATTSERVGGVFTLLWHNTMVDSVDKPGPAKAYSEITSALKERPAWAANLGECAEAWRLYCDSLEEKRG